MQQLVERGGSIALPSPLPRPSLEAQLEAAIRTPPVAQLTRRALLVLGLTLLPLGGWATMTVIEQAVLGQGQLIPEGKRKTVTLLEPGILRRLEVKEGSFVEAGQTLAQLDVTQAEAAADQARAAFWGGRARVARLRAEQEDRRVLEFPEDLRQAAAADPAIDVFLKAEQSLFAARWSNYDSQVGVGEKQFTPIPRTGRRRPRPARGRGAAGEIGAGPDLRPRPVAVAGLRLALHRAGAAAAGGEFRRAGGLLRGAGEAVPGGHAAGREAGGGAALHPAVGHRQRPADDGGRGRLGGAAVARGAGRAWPGGSWWRRKPGG